MQVLSTVAPIPASTREVRARWPEDTSIEVGSPMAPAAQEPKIEERAWM